MKNAATQQVIKTGEDPATASESLALELRLLTLMSKLPCGIDL